MPSRILLAEDDRATRESLVRALELEGYEVRAVADGSGVFDAGQAVPSRITVSAPEKDPSAVLLGGWLTARLGITPEFQAVPGDSLREVSMTLSDGGTVDITRHDGTARVARTGLPERMLPLVDRPVGEELAEELRRLDPDQSYASALSAATRVELSGRNPTRVHVWHDPALAERPDTADAEGTDPGAIVHAPASW